MESLKQFTEQLKQRLSIVDIVGKYVPLKPRGKDWWGNCPFHNEKTPSFSVNVERGIYKCFGCGEGGDIITFMMKKNGMEYIDAIRELSTIAGMRMPDFKPRDPEEEKKENTYFDFMNQATDIYNSLLPNSPAADYLKKRELSPDVIKKYRLGYAPSDNIISRKFAMDGLPLGLVRKSERDSSIYDFFRNRLMFPIIDVRGRVVAFSGRSLDGSEPKYINIAETDFFQKRRTLFGINFALEHIRDKKRAIIVEGQIDAIQMQTHGFGETVAPLGTALTTEHIEILLKYAKELVFCFDGDVAGAKAAARAASLIMPILTSVMTIKFAFMTGGKDPDELLRTGGDMNIIIGSAEMLPDFVWDIANKNFNVATESGRVQADKWIHSEFEKIPDLLLKNEYLLTLKNKEWEKWKKFRREIIPVIKTPDPNDRLSKQVAAIKQNFPELYDRHFEILSHIKIWEIPDSNMTEGMAKKIIKDIELHRELNNLIAEHAPADLIQKIKDMILELWNN